jgi:hypothetical protein
MSEKIKEETVPWEPKLNTGSGDYLFVQQIAEQEDKKYLKTLTIVKTTAYEELVEELTKELTKELTNPTKL